MFDLGWSELAVIALIALIVVGPKELPQILRTAAHWMRKARSMAREFQSSVDDMVREAELDEAKKTMDSVRHMNLDKHIEDTVDPTGSIKDEVAEVSDAAQPSTQTTTQTASGALDETPPEFRDLEDDAPQGAGKGATVIEQPAQPAPPHSIVPPKEDTPAKAEASSKTAAPKTAAKPATKRAPKSQKQSA